MFPSPLLRPQSMRHLSLRQFYSGLEFVATVIARPVVPDCVVSLERNDVRSQYLLAASWTRRHVEGRNGTWHRVWGVLYRHRLLLIGAGQLRPARLLVIRITGTESTQGTIRALQQISRSALDQHLRGLAGWPLPDPVISSASRSGPTSTARLFTTK